MNDAAALYLSYIITDHQDREQLLSRVPPAKAGAEQQQLDAYDETGCRGIIYLPNTNISKNGMRILSLAEKERIRLSESSPCRESDDSLHISVESDETAEHGKVSPLVRDPLTSGSHLRRASGSMNGYLGLLGIPSKAMSELDRARSRIQGEELEKTGQYGNDLWRIAINMLCLCREIQPPQDKKAPLTIQPVIQADIDPSSAEDFPPLKSPSPPRSRKPIIKSLDVPGFPAKNSKPLAHVVPLSNGNPNQSLLPRSYHSTKASRSEVPSVSAIIPRTALPMPPTTKGALAVARAKTKAYLSELPCGFTAGMWWRILGDAAGARGILSETQQKSVLAWAMDKNTLSRGREWLGEKEANQIWHVLDRMGCLAYQFDA